MAQYTANAIQTVDVNQNVLFTETPIRGNCSIVHREGSGLVSLRGVTEQCRARFKVFFSGNIAVPTGETVGPVSLALALNGESVATTDMIVTPAAVDNYFNVATAIYIDVPKNCCTQVSVQNTSDIEVSVQNANLIVERVA